MVEKIALHRAVANCSSLEVISLLDQGTNIQSRDLTGQTALHVAIINKFKILTYVLLERGADPNVQDYSGCTPLHCAVISRSEKLVRALLYRGAETEYKNGCGQTPLHSAAIFSDWKIMNTLLEKGADIDCQNDQGMTPLQIIISRKYQLNDDDLNVLINLKNERDETAIHIAVKACWVSLAKALLSRGAEADSKNKKGCTPLHIGIRMNYEPVVLLLLEFGADANRRNEKNISPLHSALLKRNLRIMSELLKKGADVNSLDDKGKTLLLIAVEKGFVPEVRLLLNSGAEVNTRSASGETPFHCALKNRDLTLMEDLLDKGADIELANEFGGFPLHVCIYNDFEEEFEFLLNRGADFNRSRLPLGLRSPFEMVVDSKNLNFLKKLANKEADINFIDSGGNTLFFTMVNIGFDLGIAFVLDRAPNIIMKDQDGKTPLHFLNGCSSETIDMLLKYGFDLESRDNCGCTPLLNILKESWFDYQNIVTLLVAKGADVKAVDSEGKTVLHYKSLTDDLLETFLSLGVDPNTKDNTGQAPVHVFAESCITKLDLLLAAGGNIDLENNDGVTTLQLLSRLVIIDAPVKDTKKLLSAVNMYRETLLHIAVDNACLNLVGQLLKKGTDVNVKDYMGNTPLHVAAKLEEQIGCKIVEELCISGAVVNMQNGRGQTPLHLAVVNSRPEIVEELLANGACKDIADNLLKTPLDFWDRLKRRIFV